MERRIVIGLIVSTEYLKRVRSYIEPNIFESQIARLLSEWALAYFDEYGIAAQSNIETVYHNEIRRNKHRVSSEIAQEIEEDILPDLSEEFIQTGIHIENLVDETITYCNERRLVMLKEGLENAIDNGDVDKAEQLINRHKTAVESDDEVIFNNPSVVEVVQQAFEQQTEPLIRYPGALGHFWNNSMVAGGFVVFLAPEKRGKTWLLMDAAVRAARQKRKVVFVQTGDMTRNQQIRRIGTHLTGLPSDERYTSPQYIPVKDCVLNQLNLCNKNIRECDFGVFEDRGWDEKTLRKERSFEDLVEAYEAEKDDYMPCHNCSEYMNRRLGTVWLKKEHHQHLISDIDAMNAVQKHFVDRDRHLRMLTFPNDSLSIGRLKKILQGWEMRDGFVPEVLVIDYMDLLVPETKQEFRHQQNHIWKQARGLNQELNCLLLSATQADADSYDKNSLGMKNFSEDKRKLAHVTAMYGLNQDKTGNEKKMKALRINEIIMREGDFAPDNQVTVLQALCYGRPIITSFY
jgi:hypothetical protein